MDDDGCEMMLTVPPTSLLHIELRQCSIQCKTNKMIALEEVRRRRNDGKQQRSDLNDYSKWTRNIFPGSKLNRDTQYPAW